MTRIRKRFIALVGIAALVLAQLGVAAHACPKAAGIAAPAPVEVAGESVAMPCGDMGAADSPLCQQHCNGSEGAQNSLAAVPALPAPAFVIAAASLPQAVHASVPADPALVHATSPPPTIRNCCFRL